MRLFLLIVFVALTACTARQTETTFDLAPATYAAAFDAAREALLDCRFTLERVDANAGIITTAPKATAGLLSPWDGEQSSFHGEIQDLVNDQRRIVRIEFHAADVQPAGEPATPGEAVDLAASPAAGEGPLIATVRVVIERRHIPGRQVEPESIRRSTTFLDLDLLSRGMQPVYYVPIGDDPQLAARLVEMIQARLEQG